MSKPYKAHYDLRLGWLGFAFMVVCFAFLVSCDLTTVNSITTVPAATLSASPFVTDTPSPTTTPELTPTASYKESGPERASEPQSAFPTELSYSEVLSLIGQYGMLPEGFLDDLTVKAIIESHKQLLRNKDYNVDDRAKDDYIRLKVVMDMSAGSKWELVPVDFSGHVAKWLLIRDQSLAAGWRLAERPTWDSQLGDQYGFSMPNKLNADNYFDVILKNGNIILVEFLPSGSPIRFFNAVTQEMQGINGAPEPTATPLPEWAHSKQWQKGFEVKFPIRYSNDPLSSEGIATIEQEAETWLKTLPEINTGDPLQLKFVYTLVLDHVQQKSNPNSRQIGEEKGKGFDSGNGSAILLVNNKIFPYMMLKDLKSESAGDLVFVYVIHVGEDYYAIYTSQKYVGGSFYYYSTYKGMDIFHFLCPNLTESIWHDPANTRKVLSVNVCRMTNW